MNISLGTSINNNASTSKQGFHACLIQVLNSSVVSNISTTRLKRRINTFKTAMKHTKTLFKCLYIIELRRLKLNISKSSILEQLDRSTFAVRETLSLGIMGEPRVPPLNPSESIVLSEHYRKEPLRVDSAL